jgi:hypothetical protein
MYYFAVHDYITLVSWESVEGIHMSSPFPHLCPYPPLYVPIASPLHQSKKEKILDYCSRSLLVQLSQTLKPGNSFRRKVN